MEFPPGSGARYGLGPLLDEAELEGEDHEVPSDKLSRQVVGLGGPEEEL